MFSSIMIMCEPGASPNSAALNAEMITCALMIAGGKSCRITAVMPVKDGKPAPQAGVDLLVLTGTAFACYSSEAWEKAALAAAERLNPDLIIIPHTSSGYDYAPRVAAKLSGPCVTSVFSITAGDGGTQFRRSGFHGKLELVYETGRTPAVITVMPGAFSSGETPAHPGSVEHIDAPVRVEKISEISITASIENNPELENAEVVVSAGRGIGKQENLQIIRSLAALFKKSSIAGSRVLCDNGWIEYRYQVGLTGKKVSPRLYIACGISGSPQHIAGMKDSGCVVSINRDPYAAISGYSDICVVEDLEKFIPEFIEAAKGHAQKK